MRALPFRIGILVLSLTLTTAFSWAAEIDWHAVKREADKQIIPLNNAEIDRQYELYQRGLDDLDRYDGEQVEFDFSEYAFDDDDSDKVQAPRTIDVDEERIQINILNHILSFEKEHALYRSEIKELINGYVKASRDKGNEFLPSEMAQLIGELLNKKNEYDWAIKFYMLAASSNRSLGEEHLAVGAMLVRYFNSEVAQKKPKAPTSELFAAVRKAIFHYDCGSMACEIGDYYVDALKQVRDMMVRWPVSPQQLEADSYYGPHSLLEKIYGKNFINTLLNDIRKLDSIFNAKIFVEKTKDNNLLDALKNAGFKGIIKSFGNEPQYIWANPDGFIVRIKSVKRSNYANDKKGDKPKGEWQFSVGLSFINPFKWQDERVVGVKKIGDLACDKNTPYVSDSVKYDDIASFEYNEIFKIVKDGNLVMLVPAFRGFYWFLRGQELNIVMKKAHTNLSAVAMKSKLEAHCHLSFNGKPINGGPVRSLPESRGVIGGGVVRTKNQYAPKP